MKRILYIIFLLCLTLISSSCSLLRDAGLYKIPPKYSDSFKEYYHLDFIKHDNDSKNLTISLVSLKDEYSPYEEIELKLRIYNNNPHDTIYIYEPYLTISTYPWRHLYITDSIKQKVEYLEGVANVDYTEIDDKYGRRLSPILAPFNVKIPPLDSIVTKLSFYTGQRICQSLMYNTSKEGRISAASCNAVFNREHFPGEYNVFYFQAHERYDQIKGPINDTLISPIVKYKVRNYREDEILIRIEVQKIMNELKEDYDSTKSVLLYEEFLNKFPGSRYLDQIRDYIDFENKLRRNISIKQ